MLGKKSSWSEFWSWQTVFFKRRAVPLRKLKYYQMRKIFDQMRVPQEISKVSWLLWLSWREISRRIITERKHLNVFSVSVVGRISFFADYIDQITFAFRISYRVIKNIWFWPHPNIMYWEEEDAIYSPDMMRRFSGTVKEPKSNLARCKSIYS